MFKHIYLSLYTGFASTKACMTSSNSIPICARYVPTTQAPKVAPQQHPAYIDVLPSFIPMNHSIHIMSSFPHSPLIVYRPGSNGFHQTFSRLILNTYFFSRNDLQLPDTVHSAQVLTQTKK